MTLTYGSLFSGIGGFDLAFDRAGMKCVWQVEKDKQASAVLAKRWPAVPRIDDVVRARAYIERFPGRLVRPDIVCGGFPCQDLSVAGKRAGLAGSRSGLFWVMRRIIAKLKPTWFVLENVPGLLSSNRGRDMGAVVKSLVDSGYGIAWRVLDAQFFGLAQRRKRVFIVGCLGDVQRAGSVLFDGESVSRDTPPSREARKEVANALTRRPDGGGGNSEGQRLIVAEPCCIKGASIGRAPKNGPQGRDVLTDGTSYTLSCGEVHAVAHTLTGNSHDAGEGGSGRGTPLVAACLNAKNGKRYEGESEPFIPSRVGVRRLMPIECERLQGFPDGWTEGHSDSARYRMLGNAVAVPVAEWIGRRIVEASK